MSSENNDPGWTLNHYNRPGGRREKNGWCVLLSLPGQAPTSCFFTLHREHTVCVCILVTLLLHSDTHPTWQQASPCVCVVCQDTHSDIKCRGVTWLIPNSSRSNLLQWKHCPFYSNSRHRCINNHMVEWTHTNTIQTYDLSNRSGRFKSCSIDFRQCPEDERGVSQERVAIFAIPLSPVIVAEGRHGHFLQLSTVTAICSVQLSHTASPFESIGTLSFLCNHHLGINHSRTSLSVIVDVSFAYILVSAKCTHTHIMMVMGPLCVYVCSTGTTRAALTLN